MKVLKARERLEANMSASWPYMKDDNKKKAIHRGLLKDAELDNRIKVSTASDLKRILGNG